jgi:hypothetical protein
MNATAHESVNSSLDRVINLWPEDPAEDTLEMGLRQRAALFSATGVGLAGLFAAIVLQTAYHAVILLWVLFGLPLLFVAKAIAHIYKSLEAIKTLGLLPPQDELLEDTIQVVDQSLNMFAR